MSEKQQLVVATVLHSPENLVYATHLNMMYRAGRDLKDWNLDFFSPSRMPIDSARNLAAQYAMSIEAKYILFYDDDMYLNPDTVKTLVDLMEEDRDRTIIMSKCFIRGMPFHAMIFKHIDKNRLGIYENYEKDVPENGLLEVDAVGCACTIIDVNLFKHMSDPFFLTGKYHTEDVYFCLKAKQEVENVNIYMYDKMETGHLLDRTVLTSNSKRALTEMDEKGFNQLFMPKIEPEGKEDPPYTNPLMGE